MFSGLGKSLSFFVFVALMPTTVALCDEASDKLIAARLAAIDGHYEKCARLSDEARRVSSAHWRAHQVYASCTVFAADAEKENITSQAYADRLQNAISALQFLLNTPGILIHNNQRQSVGFMITQLGKRIEASHAEMLQ